MAKIAIIGGGVAGLSAGIYAQLSGHEAHLYERHFKAGGNLTAWDRDGYHIDNCIHWLTGTNPVTSLYRTWVDLGALGEGVEVYQGESLYTFLGEEKESVSLHCDLEKMRDEMLAISKEDRGEILSLIRAVRAFQRINGISGDRTKKSTAIEKIFAVPALIKYFRLSTEELAARFRHPALRGFIESLLCGSLNSLALIMVFATFTGGDGGIPRGGSSAMAERMAKRFLSLGGRLRLRSGVEKINISSGRAESITLESGAVEPCDYVIIATDPAAAFGKLLDKSFMPKSLKREYESPNYERFSSYHTAFSVDCDSLPFTGDVMFEIPEKYRVELGTKYLILREFSHEPSYAPKGKNIIQTMTYLTEDGAREFIELNQNKEAYKEKKKRLAAVIEKIITERFPSLRGRLGLIDVWTPATYRRFVGSEIGSWMTFLFAANTPPVKLSPEIDGLENVFLGTQWLQAPGGLPIAAERGIAAARAAVKKAGKA